MPLIMNTLQGRKILLGVTGSIAAYKSLLLLRLLTKAGAEVQVILTKNAHDFVGELSFSTLSNKPVYTDLQNDQEWQNHVELGLWADLILIAPASAHTIAKFRCGMVDNLLTAIYLSAKCPVMISPAMDLDMWQHPATQDNLQVLVNRGHFIIPVEDGPLASGLSGPGRLAEPDQIRSHVISFFDQNYELSGQKILITAGPTHEAIDPVRFISNASSGKMGIRLAEEAVKRGAEVWLILGPSEEPVTSSTNLHIHRIISADNMMLEVEKLYKSMDYFILAAAVADFKPEFIADEKIKKSNFNNQLKLVPTPDIASFIGKNKKSDQKLIGFALETTNIIENAQIKLDKKNMDMIVINSPKDPGAAFGHDTNKISILKKAGELISFELKSKENAAKDILNEMLKLKH